MIVFQDVFAKDEFDLGNFTAIEHSIDTGDNKPVKQRMRSTPVGFERKEEAHLQKMLDAGVIKPSISEWASAPVLVSKRDEGVRWCEIPRMIDNTPPPSKSAHKTTSKIELSSFHIKNIGSRNDLH